MFQASKIMPITDLASSSNFLGLITLSVMGTCSKENSFGRLMLSGSIGVCSKITDSMNFTVCVRILENEIKIDESSYPTRKISH